MSEVVTCSRCGSQVSNEVTVANPGDPLVVRAWVECPECVAEHVIDPHAYGVEVLVNPGSPRAYWRLDEDERARRTIESAEALREAMIDLGHVPEQVRIVAITGVKP